MTVSPEHPPSDLFELSYPSDLRADRHAITYSDRYGNRFLEPLLIHDFDMTSALIDNGLSCASLVNDHFGKNILIKYSSDTDLLPLPSIFNSSVDTEEFQFGVDLSLKLVATLLSTIYKKLGITPSNPVLDMFAIDKNNERAELIAPFTKDLSKLTAHDSFLLLQNDALLKSKSDDERTKIIQSFTQAWGKLGN